MARQLASGGRGLILAGNAREPHDPGPPVVTEEQICDELGLAFQILDLHEFRFDEAPGVPERFLGWSCLVESVTSAFHIVVAALESASDRKSDAEHAIARKPDKLKACLR